MYKLDIYIFPRCVYFNLNKKTAGPVSIKTALAVLDWALSWGVSNHECCDGYRQMPVTEELNNLPALESSVKQWTVWHSERLLTTTYFHSNSIIAANQHKYNPQDMRIASMLMAWLSHICREFWLTTVFKHSNTITQIPDTYYSPFTATDGVILEAVAIFTSSLIHEVEVQ